MKKTQLTQIAICLLSFLLLDHCSKKSANSEINDLQLVNADQYPGEWWSYGRNYQEDRHSRLNQINKTTIDSLGLVWSINLGTKRGLEATPLFANGVLYFTATWSRVFAVDVRKGEVL